MHKTSGFTLIELLVVIAIIALLMSILVPVVSKAKVLAKTLICRRNVKDIAMAWFMYADDNDGLLVGADGGPYRQEDWAHNVRPNNFPCSTPELIMNAIETGKLFPYLKTLKVYHCPADLRYKNAYGTVPGDGLYRSYRIADGMNGLSYVTDDPYKRYLELKRPAEFFLLVEQKFPQEMRQGAWHIDGPDHWCSNLALWHNNNIILGFADGHVELKKLIDKRTIVYHNRITHTNDAPAIQRDNPDLDYMWNHYPRKGEN